MTKETIFYVRNIYPNEVEQAARVLHDAFYSNREHRYFSGTTFKAWGTPLLCSKKVTTRLQFYLCNIRAVLLLDGQARIAVRSNRMSTKEGEEKEEILGVLLWLPPKKKIGMDHPLLLYQAGFSKIFCDWGYKGYKRIIKDWEDPNTIETKKLLTCKEVEESGLIHMLGVDPIKQGQGVGTMLLQDLEALNLNIPTMLHATETKNRDFYAKMGYVVRGSWKTLSGIVDDDGLPVNRKRVNYEMESKEDTCYLMIKSALGEEEREVKYSSERASVSIKNRSTIDSNTFLVELFAISRLK